MSDNLTLNEQMMSDNISDVTIAVIDERRPDDED